MRILLVNKFIFPKGGAETYTFDVGKMLEEHGHEVQYFGLENEKNIVGNRVGSYVTNMDFSQGIKANLNAPFRIIYSREARKKIRAVLDDFQPDVVHLNNIQYHLTPSIILEINKWRKETKKECKIVYTTHDYQLVCPSHGMFDVNMKPCERCLDGHYIHCLQTKCLKNSRAKSLLGTVDGYMWKYSKACHRNTRNIWNGMVTDSVSGLIRLELTQVRLSMRYLPPAELNSNPTEAAWDY